MANSKFLRRSKAGLNGSTVPALELRFILLLLVGTASLLTLAAGLTATSRGLFGHGHQQVSFLERTVGAPAGHSHDRPLVKRYASSHTRVTLHRSGATIVHGGRTLTLAAAGAGSALWQPRANGAIRSTPFGSEGLVSTGTRTEDYLNINSRVGVRTWRWHLGTDAVLAAGGTVLAAGMTIRPPVIYDDHGRNVTPAGARWSVKGQDLLLRLDDAKLPVPYLIDPEADYGSGSSGVLYLSTTASKYSTGVGGTAPGGVTDTLATTSPGAAICTAGPTTGGTCPGVHDASGQNTGGLNYFMPFVNNKSAANGAFVAAASIAKPSAASPYGFIVENGGQSTSAGTVIPAGNWTFTVPTTVSGFSTVANLFVSVGAWVVNDNGTTPTNGTSISSIGTQLIDPTTTVTTTNLALAATGSTVTNQIVVAMPKEVLTSQQHILVTFYAVKVTSANNKSCGCYLWMGANGTGTFGGTTITTAPNLTFEHTPLEVPRAPTSLTAGQVGGYVKTVTPTLSATYVTPGNATTDQGQVDFFLCPTNADCSGGAPTWNGPSTSVTLTNNGSGSVAVPSAKLVDGSTYYLEARTQATDPNNANAVYGTAITSPLTALQSLRVDATAPGVTITTPVSNAYYGNTTAYPTAWTGTATDGGTNPSGIPNAAAVQISYQDPTGKYWNGASWQVGATTVSATSFAAGTWNYTAPAIATNGTYNVTVTATDAAGNSTSTSRSFVYDNVVPNTLTIGTPVSNAYYGGTTAYPTAWTGTAGDATSGIPNAAAVQITYQDPTGKYWNGATWQVGATSNAATSFAAGTWNYTAPAITTNGTYTVTVKATDAAGNNTSVSQTFVYDNVNPNTASFTTPVANSYYGGTTAYPTAWSGSAADGTAGVANAAAVQIKLQDPSGNYWNGASWQAGVTSVSSTSFAAGTWNWTSPAVSVNGTYNATVTVTDRAGNATSSSLTFVYDNTNPNTASFTAPTANAYYGNTTAYPTAWSGGAADATAGVANAAAVQITYQDPTGKYWNGASWQVGATSNAATSFAAGTWNYTAPAIATNGTYNVSVKVTDRAGNVTTTNESFVYDDVNPSSVTITTPTSNAYYGGTTAYPTAWTGSAVDATAGFANAAAIQVTYQDPTGKYWNGASWQAGATTVSATSLVTTTWSWTAPGIATNGTYNVTVTATDRSGNTASASQSFTYDSTNPNTASIATPLANAYYGGTTAYPTAWTGSAGDATAGVANAAAVQITYQDPTGKYWNGASWQVGATSNAATSLAGGTWNYTAPAIATNGTYNVTLTVTDRAGNSASSSLSFVYDNTNPNTASIATPTANAYYGNTTAYPTAWTGSAGDATAGVANAAAVQITYQDPTGKYWNGASWQVGATSNAATSLAGGTWNYTAPAIATNGTYNVTLTVTDRAGNSASTTSSFTYDNVAPNTVTIGTPAANAYYGNTTAYPTAWTGSAGDATAGVANAAAVQITYQDPTGKYWNGASWQVGATSNAATSLAGGTWNYTAPAIATNGTYNVTLTVTDRAGNSASTSRSFTYDTIAPNTLSATTPVSNAFYGGTTAYPTAWAGNAGDATSPIASVQVTLKDPTGNYWNGSIFSGTVEASAWQTASYAAGAWSYTPGANSAPGSLTTNGTYTVHVRATDQAGNTTTNSTYTFTYDNVAPNTLTATTPASNAYYGGTTAYPTAWAGTAGDATSNVSTVEVTLKDPAGNYWNGSFFSGTTESTRWQAASYAGGNWTYTPGSNNAPGSLTTDGTYTVHVRVTDQAGNTTTNATYTFVYDATLPATGITTPASGANYGATTAYPTAWSGSASDATSGLAGATSVQISLQDPTGKYWNSASWQAGAATVAASSLAAGTWNWTSPAVTVNGTYNVVVTSTDRAGNQSSSTRSFVYDNTAPDTLTATTPAAASLFTASSYPTAWSGTQDDATSGVQSVQLTLADPSGNYWNGASFVSQAESASWQTTSLGAGTWSWTAPSLTTNGTYTVHLRATDQAGNTTTNATYTFVYDSIPPAYSSSALSADGTQVILTLNESGTGLDTGSTTPGSGFTVSVNGSGDSVNTVSTTDATHVRLTLATRVFDGDTVTVAYNPASLTTAQKVKDMAGNTLGSVSAQSVTTTAAASLAQSTVTASPGSITANGSSTSTITVRLKNAAGTNLAVAGGTVTVQTTDGSLGSVTDNHDGTYTATLTSSTTAHGVTVSAKLDGSSISNTAGVTFTPGAAAKLAFGVQPTTTAAGQSVSPSITVRVLDANNNLVTGSSASVTVALSNNPGSSSLSGTTTRTASAGVATFDDLSLNKVASGYTLAASSGILTGATSNGFDISSAAAANIAVNAGEGQSATVDTNVSTAPSVLVTDAFGNPVAGVAVTFSPATGSVTGGSATTNASGIATVGSWKLGQTAGANTMSATASVGSVTFHATGTAGAAASIARNGGEGQSATVDNTVSTAPSALVTDSFGNPVAGVAVTFAVASGGGSVTGASATTNASGVATVGSWKLGTTAGANTMTATASVGSVTFHATGVADTAGAMTVNGGDNQSATVDTNVGTAPSVLVTDLHGNPVSGVSVTFAAASGGGSVTGASATTNASGIAAVGSWKLGTTAGANTLTASSTGLSSVTFNATGTAAAATTIAVNAGDNQHATVNTTVATAPSVSVTDTYGNPVSSVGVTFAVASGAGSVTGASASTNGSGIATVGSWKLGTAAGANTITATASVGSVTFHATGDADSLDHLVLSPASASISADVGTQAYTAEGRDQYDNSLGDATTSTTFTVAGGSCTGASCTVTSAGDHTVTGTLLGASGTATLHITAGAPANVALQGGDNQSATVNTAVATAPSVKVTDAYGNAVAGTSVTFAAASGGGSVSGGSATTNASGIATVGSWTLGTGAGANALTATSTGLAGSPVTFNATGTADVANAIARNTGEGQSATVDTNVSTDPAVLVTDQFGNPVSGVGVTFAVATGNGSVTGASATTNASGVATVGSWKLGQTAGSNTVTATASVGSVTFHATGVHDAATTIAINDGDAQSATVNTTVSTAPSALVTDQFGNGVPGVAVTFAVASGGGSATGTSATTNASGIATAGSWKLGTAAGANTLTATASVGNVTFSATGTADAAAAIAVNGGDNQSATVNTNVSTAPSALVTDQFGNAVAGVAVTFAAAAGGGSVTGGSATTNASGVATVGSWKLGTTAGANSLTATTSVGSVTFNATGVHGAANAIAINGGDNQSATVNTNVTTAPSAIVGDQFGNPVPGVAVTFAIATGNGSVTSANATTDASGVATAGSWKLGQTAGGNTLTATASAGSVTFHATGVHDAATTIAINGGDGQSATVNTNVSTAPSALVSDQFGNPVSGVAVTFAVASGNGSATGPNATTNGSGVATVGSWKLGQTAGSNTLTATASVGSVTFSATGTAGAAASIALSAGDGQVATVNSNVTTAPAAFVADSFGNPVSGVAVTFAVASGNGAATGTSTTTNASGVATVGSWKLGQTSGANTLSATASVGSVTFNATGVPDAASTMVVNAGDNQSATVNTNVGTDPSVLVSDQYGNPVSGVGVTFAVASGGGAGTGLSQTTGADGIATASSWTLGTGAGANTFTATASVGSVTFHATGTAGAATSITRNDGEGQSATVDTNVSTAPSVLVSDAFGNPVANAGVTFAVASGNGSATGTSATTDASGVATVGSWTLGTAAGANTLSATASVGSVTFHATGVAGAAGSMTLNGGEGQSATVNTTVATAPSVLVTDAHGNPVAGIAVTFAVGSGGGSVTGGGATTDASGVATVGSWKLGTGAGTNTLTVSSTGLSSVTVHATGAADSAASIAVSSGDNQTATVDTNVSGAPSVRIADQYGNPVAGISVTFAAAGGGGSVTGANATSNSSGIAAVGSWKLGTTAGANTLTATSAGLTGSPVTFHATGLADSAGSMAINDGEGQSATVNTTVATAPSVLVTDAHGNPVSGVSVHFAIATGAGSVTGANQVTDASGIATVGSWKLGITAGSGGNTLSVTSSGLPSVTFHATGTADSAANLDPYAGDSQSATVNTTVATAPAVRATDAYGNPVSGVSVTFAAATGGGSGTGLSRITGSDGVATAGSWKLGTTTGANTFTATSAGLTGSPVTFTATGTPDSAIAIVVQAGDNQSATVNTALPTAPTVKVSDQYGNGVSGVAVTYAVASGGGSATGLTPTTNASGVATVGSWTLGTGAGANTLTATASVGNVTFHATGTADAASALAIGGGDNQSATANTSVSTAPSVTVSDAYGNPVSGVAVTFAVASGGGSVTGGSATTNASGIAAAGSWKLGTAAGANTLTASASVGSVTFHATALADAPGSLTVNGGEGQSATVNTTVATAPSVLVTDQYGNPVSGVGVTFAVASGGGSATGTSATTNASGVATVGSWKVGQTAGANTLTAASTGLSTITFHGTGTADAAATLAVNGGDNQTATVDTNVSSAPSVIAADQFGNPVAGVGVTFAVTAGSGSVTGGSTTTNASGVATVGSWKLGTTAGANALTASASGLSDVVIHATGVAGTAGSLAVNGGDNQSATVNTNVATAPSVLVTDAHGNPVSGVAVTFSVASGGGSVTGGSATTNASGVATVGSWKLGTGAGANTLSVTSTGLPSATVHATGAAAAAASLALQGGDNQSATVNTAVATAPSVVATDTFGNPVAGVSVTFAAASGGGSVTGGSATTNASGVATVGSWKLGTGAGANTLTATSGSLTGSPVTFSATGTPDSLDHLAVAPATATVSAGVTQSFTADGRDQYDNTLGDVTSSTSFTLAGGSCLAAVCSSTSAGSHLVTGTFAGATGLATLTVVPGAPASLVANGGDNQTATVNTAVTAPSALVTDSYGNPVSGVSVTFAVASGGGSVSGAGQTTNASGVATLGSWTLGTGAGANTLSASSSGLATLTFHATGTHAAAASIARAGGEGQSATVGNAVATAPSARVTDTYGNPVPGVAVTFAVATGGGSATGTNATTDASGVAAVGSWTLGTTAGANTLSATASVGAVTFHATGLAAGSGGGLAVDSGDGQTATVNTNVATAPTVRALDQYGNPVSGVSVTFAVSAGTGSVTGGSQVTDANGYATAGSWKLGTAAGANTLTATATGFTSADFDATGVADAPASISVNAGEGESATANTNVATAPSVLISDQYGNPVSGVAVTFAVASGNGSAGGTSATTNASGIATVGNWKLGTSVGANTLTASSSLGTITFHATATADAASAIGIVAGEGQGATVNTTVATAPAVAVTDQYGNPVSGVAVTFAIASGNGSVTGASATTNASGVATAGSWQLGQTAGANTLSATASAGSVTFHATGTADTATAIARSAGEGQSATVNTTVATAPAVLVSDQFGNPVAGVAVTFAAASGGGSVTGGSATTNASGVATAGSWKLGTGAGANTLTASSSAGSVTFHATGTVDAPASMGISVGDGQSATVNTNVATSPAVLVADQFGNPISGVAVTFNAATGGGSATGTSATTNASGVATVGSWQLGTAVGDNTLTAAASGLTTVTFHATGTVDAPASIAVAAGDNQSATVDTTVATAPSVLVADQFGNPVPGVAVTFAAASGGGSATGASATTNASGVATVGSWKLGQTAGANTLSATASAGSVTFHATGTAGAATTIARTAGEGQSATVNTNVATAPAALVTDQFGNPVSGIAVTFTVASGGGSAGGTSATTDASGVATVGNWTVGTAAGANTLTATASAGSVTFHATGTADAPTAIARSAGEGQTATVNTTLSTAPAVLVTDQFSNPVSGVAVTFAVASGGGSVTGGSATTNASGIATLGSWQLGQTAGANTLTATAAVGSVTFHATGSAAAATTIARTAGEGQTATVNTNVATAPAALVTDQFGNPVSGIAVAFAVASGGGSAGGTSATTDASGVATVGNWKLGTAAGANTLTATASVGSVTFHATGSAGSVDHLVLSPASATITSDDSQTYTVEGRDQFDNTLGDVTGATTLSITGGVCVGAVCSAPTVGSHTVTGSMLGAVGNATLNVTSGAASQLVFVSPNSSNLALGATRNFTTAIEDAQGNVVTSDNSSSVTFARTAGTGNLTGLGAATVTAGAVTKTLTASAAGSVTLTATTGSFSDSVTFTVDPAPVATIDSAPSDPSGSANATFDYSANDGAATFECRLDGATYAACPGTGNGSKGYTGLASGSHTFDVRAVSATATGPVASSTWTVDTSFPTVSLDAPADGSYITTATRALSATANDTGTGVGAVDFEFSSTAGASCSTGTWALAGTDTSSPYAATWTTPADGTYALRAVAHDGAGHSSCSLVHVTVDQTAPAATLVSPAASVRGTITLHATGVADATSGLNSVSFEQAPTGTSSWSLVGNGVAQGGGAYDASFDTTGVSDGLYDFRVTVTDVAGNLTQQVVGPIRIDNTPPTSSMGAVAAFVRGTIALTSTASDPGGSGVATTGYEISPHNAGTWTSVPASFDTTTKTDGDYDIRTVVTDNVGNIGHSAAVPTKIDNTPPAATLDAIARYVRGSLTLSSTTSDAGSGLASFRYEISTHGAGSWSTVSTPLDTSTKTDGDYDFRVVAIDNAGNRTDSAAQLVTIDNTAPNAQLDSPASSAILRGTIDFASTDSDATSGVSSITYRVAPAGTPEAAPCDTWGNAAPAHFDTTTLADGLYDFRVIVVDNAGNGRCSAINTSARIDNTAPTTADDAPAGPQNHDVTVHLTPNDGGSGVTSTVYTVDGGPQQTGTTVVIPAAGNDGTHTIVYHSTDAAGNVESAHTAQVVIDTTAPTGGAGNGGNAVHGDYVLTDSPSDTIASVEFQERVLPSDPWTSIGTDTNGSDGWHVTWHTASTTDGSHHLRMIETDDAGNTTVTPLADTVVDNTAPASASVSVSGCAARCSGTNVIFNGSADASVSGIGAMDFQVKASGASGFTTVGTQTAGFAFHWDSTTVPDGPVDVRIGVTDAAGNGPTYSPVVTINVDNNAPTVSATVASTVAGTVSLGATGSADIASVSYDLSPHSSGTWTNVGSSASSPFTFSWNTTARADGVYDLRVTATDFGGNTGTDLKTITIDNTAPTGTMSQPTAGATVGGHAVALGASTHDSGGSGVASVSFQYRPAGSSGSFTDIGGGAWNAAALSSADYDVRAKITDGAGNVGFSPAVRVTVDSTAPTLSLASLATALTGTITVDASIAGATDATLQVRSGSGSWTTVATASSAPLTFAFDTTVVPDGTYDIRAIADDAFDNEAIDTRTGIRIDNTPPSLVSSDPADGTVLPAGSTVNSISLVTSEDLSAITSLQIDGDPAVASATVSGSTATVPTPGLTDGAHYVTGVLVDTAGKTRTFRVNVSIMNNDGSIPPVMHNAPADGSTVTSAADSSATVSVPVGSYSQPSNDFLVLRVVPLPPSIATLHGFESAGSIIDVTMLWNSTGYELHHFDSPLQITMADPTGGSAIPATAEAGTWRLIPQLSEPGVLPSTQSDGYYRDENGIHVLTHHLSQFTLVRDIELPAAPRDFGAVVADDGLTLRWAPGMDQTRIQNFVLYVDGQPYRYFGPTEFETKLGAFTADDTRTFAIAEINTSGISSAPTTPLVAVPPLTGRTVQDATAALAVRGFTVGKLTPTVSSAPAGTVVGPAGVQLLPAGSIVDLQVAGNSVPRQAQFVLRISVQKRVRVTNHSLVARIQSTAPAKIAATLDGANYRRIQRWHFTMKAGVSLHTLKLHQRLAPGAYTLYWLGRTDDGSTFRMQQQLLVIGEGAKAHTANPAQIVLTVGPATTKTVQRTIQPVGQTIEATPEQAFDVASKRDASVIIVDADKYGVNFVRQLTEVFPTTYVVAISKSPVTLDVLRREHAIAVPASRTAAKIAALVRRLAR